MATKQITQEKDWLSTVFDSLAEVNDTRYVLEDLARAFYATGNTHVSETLLYIAKQLATSAETIRTSVAMSVNEQFKASEQSSRNMLNAALAGVELASRK